MGDWLYPLSRTSERFFNDDQGNYLSDTSYESFKRMMRTPPTDDCWYLSTNYRNVQPGDRLWCYFGKADGDHGIVGLAVIEEVLHDESKGTHDVILSWRKRETRNLLRNPVGADRVRAFIPYPRAPVWSLDGHPKLVKELLSHAEK